MAVSIFPAPSTGPAEVLASFRFRLTVATSPSRIPLSSLGGQASYRFKAFSSDGAAGVTVIQRSAFLDTLSTTGLPAHYQGSSGTALSETELVITTLANTASFELSTTGSVTIVIERIALATALSLSPSGTLRQVNTSGSVTLASANNIAVLIGGGGGGSRSSTTTSSGGTGGGSGYIQRFAISAGTYNLVIGAGGVGNNNTNGTDGSPSTFAGFTAAGGIGAVMPSPSVNLGGAGGSGGASGRGDTNSSGNPGGSNGGNGTGGALGSGIAVPSWLNSQLNVGQVGPNWFGSGGGFYQGGGGAAAQGTWVVAPDSAANTGGGGCGGTYGPHGDPFGGNGGSGTLYLLEGV